MPKYNRSEIAKAANAIFYSKKNKKELAKKKLNQPNEFISQSQAWQYSYLIADLKEEFIEPGDSVVLKVSFNTAGRRGVQYKNITVFSNDPISPT